MGLAVGLVRGGGVEFFHAHGWADIESGRPIGEDTVFRIASITKTFTAVAVMQLWERGLVDLDAPVSDYLRAFRVLPRSGDPQPTIRQLLTHTAGMPEVVGPCRALRPDFGESFPLDRPLPTLAEFYRGRLRLEAEPGTRFVYGNHGPATLGQVVEDVSGTPLSRYFREQIFVPLGMLDSDLERTASVDSGLATGYRVGSRGARAVREREMATAGAASIYSTPRDMARYVAALLGGGSNDHGRALEPGTVATMFAPHYRPDPRLPGMGLGFFRAEIGGHAAVEHQGTHPGFDSQIFLVPDGDVGVMAFCNGTASGPLWLPPLAMALLERALDLPSHEIRLDVPQHLEIWNEICGWYRLEAALSDVRLRTTFGAGVEVFVGREGRLKLRFLTPIPALYRGLELHPDDHADPYAFRVDMSEFGMGTSQVVFSRSGTGVSVHLGLMPLSLRRQSSATNPRRLLVRAAGGAAGLIGGLAAIRRNRNGPTVQTGAPPG